MRRRLFFATIMIFLNTNPLENRTILPSHFVLVSNANKRTLPHQVCIFCILVPETPYKKPISPSFDTLTKNIVIPKGLFESNAPMQDKTPTVLQYQWTENKSIPCRVTAGKSLATDLNTLKRQFPESPIILIGHGQGCNVINVATHFVKKPLPIIIQLLAPIMPDDEKYQNFFPKHSNFQDLFSFYSHYDFPGHNNLLDPKYKHKYETNNESSLYNILLLVENKQQTFSSILKPFVIESLFPLCKKIKNTFTENKNLVANISQRKQTTHLLVTIEPKKERSSDQESKTLSDQEKQEHDVSIQAISSFERGWGGRPKFNLSKREIIRNRFT